MTHNAARLLAQRLRRTPAQPETIDAAGRAILRRLEGRGIVRGVLEHEDEEPWGKRLLRILREDQEAAERYEAEKAQRDAEPPRPLTSILVGAIGGTAVPAPVGPTPTAAPSIPLNGAQVLCAALAGLGAVNGTINGGTK
jgi:hypothetical protein